MIELAGEFVRKAFGDKFGLMEHVAVAQKTGIPKWVALVSGNMGTKTCGLPLLANFEPHPYVRDAQCMSVRVVLLSHSPGSCWLLDLACLAPAPLGTSGGYSLGIGG